MMVRRHRKREPRGGGSINHCSAALTKAPAKYEILFPLIK